MNTNGSIRSVIVMLTAAVVVAVLAWAAVLTIGWFVPLLLVVIAVGLTVVALVRARPLMRR
jgi:hypothetical protein